MATVRERSLANGSTTFAVIYRHNGRQTSTSFTQRKHADAFVSACKAYGPGQALADIERTLAGQSTPARGAGPRLNDLAESFFAWKLSRVRSDRTVADYRRDYNNWIKPTLGYKVAATITEDDVQGWVDDMSTKLSPKSVGDRHSILHSIIKWANSTSGARAMSGNPCIGTELPKKRRSTPKGLRPNEWVVLHQAAMEVNPDAADLLLFLVASGWRWSEAVALEVAAVEEYDGAVFVTMGQVVRRNAAGQQVVVQDAKSEAGERRIRLGTHAADMVRRRCEHQPVDARVFTSHTGSAWRYSNFRDRVWSRPATNDPCPERKRIVERAAALGMTKPLTLHWLRHTAVAMLMLSRETTLAEIQRRIGHESILTTVGVYGRMVDDVSQAALDSVDVMLTGSAKPRELVAAP